jgi:hypothetical protein
LGLAERVVLLLAALGFLEELLSTQALLPGEEQVGPDLAVWEITHSLDPELEDQVHLVVPLAKQLLDSHLLLGIDTAAQEASRRQPLLPPVGPVSLGPQEVGAEQQPTPVLLEEIQLLEVTEALV